MNGRRRMRVTQRPGKAAGILGVVFGAVFVLIGITTAIPAFGPFGILWTVLALAITVYNGYMAFGGKYVGSEISVETEGEAAEGGDIKDRLEKLEELYRGGLVSYEEYEQKRRDIIDEL